MANVKYKEVDLSQYKNAIPTPTNNLRKGTGAEQQVGEYYYLKIDNLLPYKKQARQVFDEEEIRQLSETIKELGIRQPLSVVPSETQKEFFEVVSGERRLRAAKLIGLQVVPCIIIKDSAKAEEIALIENIQRTDLHIVEFSDAISSLYKNKERGDISDIAKKIGKSVSTISEALSISKLPDDIKSHLIERNIKSRDIVRKLISLDYEKMKEYLGIGGKNSITKSFSVVRIIREQNGYKIQDRGIKKLNEEDRMSLKIQLESIIAKL